MEIENGVYRHFKGGYVLVLFTAKHSDRDEMEVVYRGLNNNKFYARPINSFIEKVKINGAEVNRFVKASKEECLELLKNDKSNSDLYDVFCK